MDFTPELSALQGVIISADNVHQLSTISAKGGNEDKVQYVLGCMLRFLKEEDFIFHNGITEGIVPKLRKFAMFIVLNAELPVLAEMVEIEGVDTAIWTTPTISRYLMCEMLWNLHMEQFIYEIISYSYPPLALQVAAAFIDNFKYFNPTDCLEKLNKLSAAYYMLICNLHCFQTDNDTLVNKLNVAFDDFQNCLKYFVTPPNNYKLNALRRDELYRYQGDSLYALLLMAYKCISQFTQKIDLDTADSLYKLTYKEGTFKTEEPTFNLCDSPNNLILECLNKCNIVLLDTCKVLVMDVSIDVFCSWSEFEENGKTMQQTIGELCHMLRAMLVNIDSLSEHPLVSMLQQISRKPTNIKDIINTVASKSIIDSIKKNNEDKVEWLQALLFKEQLCQHKDLIEVIDLNLEVYNESEYCRLYHILKSGCKKNVDNADYLKPLLLKVFHGCNITERYKILDETFIGNCFCNMTEDIEIQNSMVEIFNKLVAAPDADLTVVLSVFLQNPKQVYTKIFTTATENMHQANIMLKVMEILSKYSNHYYNTETEPCIISVANKIFENHLDSDSRRDSFLKFICGLKKLDIIPATKLLLLIVMPNMHKGLLSKNVVAINVQVRLLREAYELAELLDWRAPMLAMIAQVMDVVRWRSLTMFVPTAPLTLNLAIDLQTSLMDTYNYGVPDKECKWLKSKLRKMQPLNMYYYRLLWNPPGGSFLDIISNIKSNDKSVDELSTAVAQIISLSTQNEWCLIWDSLRSLDHISRLDIFHEAMIMICTAESGHRTEATRACIFYCYRNFFYIIRYKFFRETLSDIQVLVAVAKAAKVLRFIQKSDVEDAGTLLMPFVAYLAEKKDNYKINLKTLLTNHFRNSHLSDMLNNLFVSNMETEQN